MPSDIELASFTFNAIRNRVDVKAILPIAMAEKANLHIIGRVTDRKAKDLVLDTGIGSRRILRKLSGEQLPRIC